MQYVQPWLARLGVDAAHCMEDAVWRCISNTEPMSENADWFLRHNLAKVSVKIAFCLFSNEVLDTGQVHDA